MSSAVLETKEPMPQLTDDDVFDIKVRLNIKDVLLDAGKSPAGSNNTCGSCGATNNTCGCR